MIPSAHNKMTMILMMISWPTSSSTLRLAMMTYSCRVEEACYEHDEAGRDPDPAAMKPACSTRLFTASQEMSPAACAFTEPQEDAAKRSILSPSTLHKAATEKIKVDVYSKSEK